MRSEAQLQGDQDKSNTAKAKRHLKAKLEENEDFIPLAIQEVAEYEPITTNNVFYAWRENRDAIRGFIDVKSSSINRSPIHEHNYFNESDNIDVPITYPDLKSTHTEDEENEENEENYIPAEEIRAPTVTPVEPIKKPRAPRRTRAEIDMAAVLLAEKKSNNAHQKNIIVQAQIQSNNLAKLNREQERADSRKALLELKRQNAIEAKSAKLNMDSSKTTPIKTPMKAKTRSAKK
jgi:hypothetical protein